MRGPVAIATGIALVVAGASMKDDNDRSRPEGRLAMQASMIARTGNCSAAITTGKRLHELDATTYERLAAEDAAFARCAAQ